MVLGEWVSVTIVLCDDHRGQVVLCVKIQYDRVLCVNYALNYAVQRK